MSIETPGVPKIKAVLHATDETDVRFYALADPYDRPIGSARIHERAADILESVNGYAEARTLVCDLLAVVEGEYGSGDSDPHVGPIIESARAFLSRFPATPEEGRRDE